ncbi:hypothetical protein [Egbenema bharatensis]|uniref:hypothetical protein n=1 Tax=Egbenema bharatensis TaxID=3463334 RepID=UPI003A8A60F3
MNQIWCVTSILQSGGIDGFYSLAQASPQPAAPDAGTAAGIGLFFGQLGTFLPNLLGP